MSPARDFVLFIDYSPYPPYREPVRDPAAAADDDFSGDWQLVLVVRCESGPGTRFERLENGPRVNDKLFWDLPWISNADDRRDLSRELF